MGHCDHRSYMSAFGAKHSLAESIAASPSYSRELMARFFISEIRAFCDPVPVFDKIDLIWTRTVPMLLFN